ARALEGEAVDGGGRLALVAGGPAVPFGLEAHTPKVTTFRPMKFVMSTAFSDPSHYLPMARAADAAGFHAGAVSDHVVHPRELASPSPSPADGAPRWQPFTPWPDPWVAIGAMAAVTERVRFMTSVWVLPLRNPYLAAKAIGTAAVLSGNRVALGVGMGWMEE